MIREGTCLAESKLRVGERVGEERIFSETTRRTSRLGSAMYKWHVLSTSGACRLCFRENEVVKNGVRNPIQ